MVLFRSATLMGRPSSSSGSGSGPVSARNRDVDKRRSRDDLLIGTQTVEKQKQAQQFQPFHVPLRNRLPSPEAFTPPKFAAANHSSVNSVESIGGTKTGVIAIGMALGSPSHAPAGAGWQPQPLDRVETAETPRSGAPFIERHGSQEDIPTKPKSRKWGLFRSRSRSKKTKGEADTPSPRAEATLTPMTASPAPPHSMGAVITSPLATSPQVTMARSPSLAAHASAKHKPLVVRSYTEPAMAEAIESQPRGRPPPPSQAQAQIQPQITPSRKPLPADPRKQARPPPPPAGKFHLPTNPSPLLDVEIPDTKMERYSIMFGHVLQNKSANAQDSSPRASLLQRRQAKATLNKLKTIDDEQPAKKEEPAPAPVDVLPPPPRVGSPKRLNSPSFNLFPPTPKRTLAVAPASPRHRSNTSPAGLPSPGFPKFGEPSPLDSASRSHTFPSPIPPSASTEMLPTSAGPKKQRPPFAAKFHRPFASAKAAASTPALHSEDTLDSNGSLTKMKATYQASPSHPTWDIVSPATPSTSVSEANTSKKSSLSSVESPEQITVVKPAPVDDKSEAEKALGDAAVQASITRQISVSRDQRQMLGSIRGRPQDRKGSVPVHIEDIRMGANERLVETKKSMPTLVVPDSETDSPRSFHRHRRSERVVVEGV